MTNRHLDIEWMNSFELEMKYVWTLGDLLLKKQRKFCRRMNCDFDPNLPKTFLIKSDFECLFKTD